MSEVFTQWNTGDLDSFLIEITADILQQKDPAGAKDWFVEAVMDRAGQKGTGKWTSISALDLGMPANSIAEAVFARCLSAIKEERVEAEKVLHGPELPDLSGRRDELIPAINQALYCSKICAYAQGFQMMAAAQHEYDWDLNFGEIASIFRGGCIIRARFLQKITDAFDQNPKLQNLMMAPYFTEAIHAGQQAWRKVVALAVEHGIPCPAFSLGPRVLRRLPHRPPAAEPAPGPARLLRGPHLRTRRPAPRQDLPRRLARTRPPPVGDERVRVRSTPTAGG